jgi:putative membrane-bound dehydrogenase-like protein
MLRYILLLLSLSAAAADLTPPKVAGDDLEVSLYASEPMVQQPIGMCFDARGRLLVIESHTHFRPKDWKGPEHDQIIALVDKDGDGKAEERVVFFDQTDMTMDLALHSSGWVYVSTRDEILRLKDEDGDGKAEKVERKIVFLETEGRYPHNGLSGLAFDSKGGLYFGMGENLGAAYVLKAGATEIADQGEGGNVFWCSIEGKRLRRVATGFWNPFGVCVDAQGKVFATDNDPDSSPPCRLHHIVEGGDYGYQFRYGRSGIHPFISWNGQLPGTLPMIAGTGEAPCDIIHYAPQAPEYRGLGQAWHGSLLVASWVDHRVESYQLTPSKGSFTTQRRLLLEGGADFRPVAFAVAADGSLYVSDWVLRDYNLHGHGRIWKVQAKAVSQPPALAERPADPDAELLDRIYTGEAPQAQEAAAWLNSEKPFVINAALWRLAREGLLLRQMVDMPWMDPKVESLLLLAARKALQVEGQASSRPASPADDMLVRALHNPTPGVALLALKWVADDRLKFCRSMIEELLKDSNLKPEIYYAALTTMARLDSADVKETDLIKRLQQDIQDPGLSPIRKRLALQIIPDHARNVKAADIQQQLATAAADYKLWLIHYLGSLPDPAKQEILTKLANDASEPPPARAAALVHLSMTDELQGSLAKLASNAATDPILRDAVLQALNGGSLTADAKLSVSSVSTAELLPAANRLLGKSFAGSSRPTTDNEFDWRSFLDKLPGEPSLARGRNVFHSPKLGGCAMCHRVEGVGSRAGPDLTAISKNAKPHYALHSLLQPNANVAPQFESYTVVTRDGQTRVAFQLSERGGDHSYVDLGGNVFSVKIEDLVSRTPLASSIMPPGLVGKLTDTELRDLIAYLESLSK